MTVSTGVARGLALSLFVSILKTVAKTTSRHDNFLILGKRTFWAIPQSLWLWNLLLCAKDVNVNLQICNLAFLVSSHCKTRISIPICN